jgi:hypothetical protein
VLETKFALPPQSDQVATSHAALEMLARARQADYLPTIQECGNSGGETRQIEALAKLRRGGEQTVRVEHVHVHGGAQSVVGNVVSRPRLREGDTGK